MKNLSKKLYFLFGIILLLFTMILGCANQVQDLEDVPENIFGPIDLSQWKLTLPVDNNGDGKPDEYEPPELNKYPEIPEVKPYFYDEEDGSLVFFCPYTAVSTANSKYSRSELREQLVPGDNNTNWTFEDGRKMKGNLRLAGISEEHRTIVMQIHGRLSNAQKAIINAKDNDAPPLLKIYVQKNKVRVARKVLVDENILSDEILLKSSWKDGEVFYFSKEVNRERFNLEVIATKGSLEVKMDEESVVFDDENIQKWPFENYYKAGNYLQSKEEGAFAEVRFYALKLFSVD